MKTVSDFKKALKVGTKLHTIYHVESKRDEAGNVIRLADGLPAYTDKDMGIAPVTVVQTTQFAVERTKTDGSKANSWMQYPKASLSQVNGNSITIFEEDYYHRGRTAILTYTIVEGIPAGYTLNNNPEQPQGYLTPQEVKAYNTPEMIAARKATATTTQTNLF